MELKTVFQNNEQEDSEMVRNVSTAIMGELVRQRVRQPGRDPDYDRLAVVALMAMVRWARSHPVTCNDNDSDGGMLA